MGKLSTEDMIKMYYYMLLTREFEARMSKLKSENKIDEGIHRSIGEEAVHVGAAYCLRQKEDALVPSLRSRAAFFVKGLDAKSVMAAVYARPNSPTGGKESSHHLGATDYNILLTTGFIGSQYPLAVGAGLALKLKKTDQVAMCFFGDGASSRGDFHESLNMASAMKLPVIFVCENNQYAMGTPLSKQMGNPEIVARAAGYGMQGAQVDGQDVLAVYETVSEAVALARKGEGPSLVECVTYRFAGHTDYEPNWRAGRPEEEYNYWRSRDPIDILEKHLVENNQMDESKKTEIQERVKQEIDDAVAYAESQPALSEEDLCTNVYCSELSSIG